MGNRMAGPESQNITWHHPIITREDREQLLGQKGVTLWFTGLSRSGKSTLVLRFANTVTYFSELCRGNCLRP